MQVRTGIGYDVHSFAEGRRLVLGGVEIPAHRGLLGHSDADVLAHAICDALLGAAVLGDIGVHFPPSDPAFKDINSMVLLKHVAQLVTAAGWQVSNINATVIAEAPMLQPHVPAMRRNIGDAVSIAVDAVSIKATTNEGLGFIGRGEGIAALAIATLIAHKPSEKSI